MRKILVIIDVQNDFVDGSLGTQEAVNIIPNLIEKIKAWDGDIIVTKDTHAENYLETAEGKKLPVKHCIDGTDGHCINKDVFSELLYGQMPQTAIMELAEEKGIAEKTLRNAKEALGIISKRVNNQWYWSLN